MNFLKDQKGSSIVSVLVAAGIGAIIFTGMSTMISDVFKSQRSIQAKDAQRELDSSIRQLLLDVTICTASFRGGQNGNIGINNSTPNHKLGVTGDINTTSGLRIAGNQICTIAGCTASSDRNLKQNIKPLENSLAKLLNLQGVGYDWKDKHQVGLIAQDLERPKFMKTK